MVKGYSTCAIAVQYSLGKLAIDREVARRHGNVLTETKREDKRGHKKEKSEKKVFYNQGVP